MQFRGQSAHRNAKPKKWSPFAGDPPAGIGKPRPDGAQVCYACSMSEQEVGSRELRNDTSGLLRRVRDGEEITITVHGRPAARLVPIAPPPRRWLPREELVRRLAVAQADPGLRQDLARVVGDTTDDLDPLG